MIFIYFNFFINDYICLTELELAPKMNEWMNEWMNEYLTFSYLGQLETNYIIIFRNVEIFKKKKLFLSKSKINKNCVKENIYEYLRIFPFCWNECFQN
jgi:hypothetical protein